MVTLHVVTELLTKQNQAYQASKTLSILTSCGETEAWCGDGVGVWLMLVELTPTPAAEVAGRWLKLEKDSCWLLENAEPWEKLVDPAPHIG